MIDNDVIDNDVIVILSKVSRIILDLSQVNSENGVRR